MGIRFVEATEEHCRELSSNLRDDDHTEIFFLSGCDDATGLIFDAFHYSSFKMACFYDERLLCMFGVGDSMLEPGVGIPWLLATPDMEQFPVHILRHGQEYVNQMRSSYEVLENFVYAENKKAIQWLKYLGFEFPGETIEGKLCGNFLKFQMEGVPAHV